ncbi:uncharacterized protein DSM5745_00310 [Aspergillus mulundensis]|uniref:Uncharacterized protein n=1 Tax=Aspergillus mulundensis TaxID=1810919 RepID=A0A3D8T4R7_9EURO|nr:hypothetical protein DSM5745_00310 [Aspergillus mulundensis]RDW92988.1 hypothetical protein DSM5745_00310 [Aspergillus mulundensis]
MTSNCINIASAAPAPVASASAPSELLHLYSKLKMRRKHLDHGRRRKDLSGIMHFWPDVPVDDFTLNLEEPASVHSLPITRSNQGTPRRAWF